MASTSETQPKASIAGIVDDPDTQHRVIPQSWRADGSIRKERRVKPGFTPAEDVSRFVPSRVLRAQETAAKSGQGVPGSEMHAMEAARRSLAQLDMKRDDKLSPSSPSSTKADATSWRRTPLPVKATPPSSNGTWRSAAKQTPTRFVDKKAKDDRADIKKDAKHDVPDDWDTEEPSYAIEAGEKPSPQIEEEHSTIEHGESETDAKAAKEYRRQGKVEENDEDSITSLSENMKALDVRKGAKS